MFNISFSFFRLRREAEQKRRNFEEEREELGSREEGVFNIFFSL